MADPEVLYVVAGVVAAALAAWVVYVLLTAPKAIDETPLALDAELAPAGPVVSSSGPTGNGADARLSSPTAAGALGELDPLAAFASASKRRDPRRAAMTVRVAADKAPSAVLLGLTDRATSGGSAAQPGPEIRQAPSGPLVVNMPPMRNRLDSHTEIRDEIPGEGVEARPGARALSAPMGTPSQDSRSAAEPGLLTDESPHGPRALILAAAIGLAEPTGRPRNESSFAIVERHHLFIIADGMTAHPAGVVASKLTIDAMVTSFDADDTAAIPDDPKLDFRSNRLRRAILHANRTVLRRARENEGWRGMGSPVVAAYFSPNNQRVHIAHVGSSRCYRLRGGEITLLTTDPRSGGPLGVGLSIAVGLQESTQVASLTDGPCPGDIYLLCSDGLSRAVREADIVTAVTRAPDLEAATSNLMANAKINEGRDNITSVLVRIDAPTSTIPPPPVS